MNGFWVEFEDDTTMNQITAGLKAVPASNIEKDDDTWFFDANWGTTRKDLNNLQGRIETGSGRGSVTGIGNQAMSADSGRSKEFSEDSAELLESDSSISD